MLIDSKTFTALSNSLGAVRKNTGAIRKTLLNNRRKNQQLQAQVKKEQALIKDQESKDARESEVEKRKRREVGSLNTKKYFGKPERALDGPITGGIGDFLRRIVMFFTFTLLGWMLNAFPKIVKAVKEFTARAKKFLKQLGAFLSPLKDFFVQVGDAVKGIFDKITQGTKLGEGDENKTRDMLNKLTESIMSFVKELPNRVAELVQNLVGMHRKVKKKTDAGMSAEDALAEVTSQNSKDSGQNIPGQPAAPIPLQTLSPGTAKGFIQGGSGFGKETAYGAHYHIDSPDDTPAGYAKVRAVAFKAARLMLQRGSTLYFGNAKIQLGPSASDQELKDAIARDQTIHSKRTPGAVDIQEGEPGKEQVIPGYLGTKSVFPLATGAIVPGSLSAAGGRQAQILGTDTFILHGGAGSTASGGGTATTAQVDTVQTRASELASTPVKKKITIDREIPIDVSKLKSSKQMKQDAIAAASEITIEVVSIDGNVTPGGMFE